MFICVVGHLNMIACTYITQITLDVLKDKTINITQAQQLVRFGLIQLPNGVIGDLWLKVISLLEKELCGLVHFAVLSFILRSLSFLIFFLC